MNTVKLLTVKQLKKAVDDLKTRRLQITLSVAYHALVFGNVTPLESLGKKELSVLSKEKQFIPAKFNKDSNTWEYDKKKAQKVYDKLNLDVENPVVVWNNTDWDKFCTAILTYVEPEKEETEEEKAARIEKENNTKAKNFVKAMKENGLTRAEMIALIEKAYAA